MTHLIGNKVLDKIKLFCQKRFEEMGSKQMGDISS
jgi:hypothetical protein